MSYERNEAGTEILLFFVVEIWDYFNGLWHRRQFLFCLLHHLFVQLHWHC